MPHPPSWFTHFRQDCLGGAVSASVAIPLALGYGMFAFIALGEAFFAVGVMAGLVSAMVVGFTTVLLGDRSRAIYAPRIVTTFFIGALLRGLIASQAALFERAGPEAIAFTLLLIILLAGAFQMLFGWIRLGSLLKHTPHPVLAGFQNAAATLLFLVQLSQFLGLPKQTPIAQLAGQLTQVQPLTLVVGLFTFVVMCYAKRLVPKIPPVITALTVGTILYYLFTVAGYAGQLGQRIGQAHFLNSGMFAVPQWLQLAQDQAFIGLLPTIVGGALGLAFIASLDALLCARILEGGNSQAIDSDRQLMRLGLGNMLAASLGGITSGLNLGPSLVNRAFGAKTAFSACVNALLVLVTVCLLLPLVAYLPRVVLSAVIMVIAIQHLDASTLPLLRRLVRGDFKDRRAMAIDGGLTVLVTLLAISIDIVTAVLVGISVAVIVFVSRLSRSVIRTTYSGLQVRSRRRRDAATESTLQGKAGSIRVMALEGAIFFGTAERLFVGVETAATAGARCIVLDLRHVTYIDITGARLLLSMFQKLTRQGVTLLLSQLTDQRSGHQVLTDVGLLAAMGPQRIFPDTDRALEHAEDLLLLEDPETIRDPFVPLERQPLFDGLTGEHLALATAAFVPRRYAGGTVVWNQGDAGQELVVIGSGSASVYLGEAAGVNTRLVTFSAGTSFGEMALLDRQPRSATVITDRDMRCFVLDEPGFNALKQAAPSVAIALLVNLSRQLSTHVRNGNRTITELVS